MTINITHIYSCALQVCIDAYSLRPVKNKSRTKYNIYYYYESGQIYIGYVTFGSCFFMQLMEYTGKGTTK